MFHKNSPIGVIDSGIGGFSVALKVQELMPHENILYLGDGANTPYGNHTAENILELTRYMLRFMEEKGVKALLVGCNTVSCLIEHYRDEMTCPVLSVVQAGADAVSLLDVKKVGIISTVFTANSGAYPALISKSAPDKITISHGCTDLARLVELNVGDPAAQDLLDAELVRELDELVNVDKIDSVLLSCTHYPLVASNIARLYPHLVLVDPSQQMATTVMDYLKESDLVNDSESIGELNIFTTFGVDEYALKASRVGLNPITSVQLHKALKLNIAE